MNRLFSQSLMHNWKRALIDTFGYEEYMDFIIQPSFGKKHLSYLPQLNYTDRSSDAIDDLLELAKDAPYQIRTLNFAYKDFQDYDPVTMRLDIQNFKSEDELFKHYKKLTRYQIRKSKRNPKLQLKQINDIPTFYALFQKIYKAHGTPLFPITWLYNLQKYLPSLRIFIYYYENEPIGGALTFCDNGIGMLQMRGIIPEKRHLSTDHYIDHHIILYFMKHCRVDIIDFGRSPYNSGTYFYKTRFGAKPVKIDIHSPTTKDIYSTYVFATKLWRKLPNAVTNFVGPKLTKYLVDL